MASRPPIYTLCVHRNVLWAGGPRTLRSIARGKPAVEHGVPSGRRIRNLYDVDGVLVAVGPKLGMRFSKDRGRSWKIGVEHDALLCFGRATDGTLWLAGEGGSVLSSPALAGPWTAPRWGAAPAVDCANDLEPAGTGMLLAHERGLLRLDASGVRTIHRAPLQRVITLPSGTLVAVGAAILRSTNAGRSWVERKCPVAAELADAVVHDGVLYVVGYADDEGVVLASHDDGRRFIAREPVPKQPLYAVTSWNGMLVMAGEGPKLVQRASAPY